MLFRMLYDEKLAQASYFVGCQRSGDSVVIDPQRDIDRYIELAEQEGMKITAIAETHIHADFLSGARQLAESTGARLYLSDEGSADWKYRWLDKKKGGGTYDYRLLRDGDTFKVGNIGFEVMHTPGHTPEHISFLVSDTGGGAEEPMGIVTGDFVFVGDVGRPDLLETAAGQIGVKEKSAEVLYRSVQRFKSLPDYLQVWPGHGAGSACGKALGAVPQSTVGYEKRFNPAMNMLEDENRFVESILYGQPEPPLYFARMKHENRDGPALLEKMPSPKFLSAEELKQVVKAGGTIVDTRPWPEFQAGHLGGALHAPLDTSFPTVVGSYIEADTAIYLVVETERLREAVTDLIRIGMDTIAGYVTPTLLADYFDRTKDFRTTESLNITEVKDRTKVGNALILDVRRADEYDAGHLPGAVNIAHTRLFVRLEEIPKDREILVHCRTDNRSAYASAMLESRGYRVRQLSGGFAEWEKTGGQIVTNETVTI